MDGNGSLFGTLAGNTREILHKFSVDLPKKHGRGGQSALRFARLRLEKRHNYVRKVAETATQMFISHDKARTRPPALHYARPTGGCGWYVPARRPLALQVNVQGIVLAGSADFKNDLAQSDIFDQRLVAKVPPSPATHRLLCQRERASARAHGSRHSVCLRCLKQWTSPTAERTASTRRSSSPRRRCRTSSSCRRRSSSPSTSRKSPRTQAAPASSNPHRGTPQQRTLQHSACGCARAHARHAARPRMPRAAPHTSRRAAAGL